MSRRTKRWIKAKRHRSLAAVGIHRYTWPALYGLDRRLVDLFGEATSGRFIEIGGNDGLQQSNTLALARLYGWRGLLIEPDPQLAAECRRNRPESVVVCAACGPAATMAWLHADDLVGHVGAKGTMPVPVLPMSLILDRLDPPSTTYDLLSLDVEGGELDVLAGLDLERHRPRFILVETSDRPAVEALLADRYGMAGQWSHHDYLFARR